MKRLLAAIAVFLLFTIPTIGQDRSLVGRYWATPPTLADTQWSPVRLDTAGRQLLGSQCDTSATISVAAAATTQIVALTASQSIYVCSFVISGDTLATTAKFVYGTGSNCATGQADLTAAMRLVDEGNIALSAVAGGFLFKTIASNALCLTAATGAVTGFVTYGKY